MTDHRATGRQMIQTLRDVRLAKGITQLQVAVAMQVNQSVISEIESGTHDPKMSTIMRYAEVLDVELEWAMHYHVEEEE